MSNQMTIPNDWIEVEDGYCLYLACVPNSLYWRAAFRGSVYALTRGRNWDFDTGNFLAIKEVAEGIYNSLMACDADELMQKLDNICKTNLLIMGALMGTNMQFEAVPDLQAYIDGSHIFDVKGITTRLSPIFQPGVDDFSISTRISELISKIDELMTVISGQPPNSSDLEDDLANVWQQLEGIVEVLGKVPEPPPTPL